ncbi:hypothetical protein MDUV_19690 [Mycolicibacterium duvalii]|uniref:Uncharacterized protein n=1 Tax=Mycolicibacterium duvalii TaxID=39688 RepID=A0A7I7K0T0_9MYCO|nr:hypothetical protein MDUV_19690 [Mycolicibacterium duvalii]
MLAVQFDDPRSRLAESLRQAILPDPRVFDEVVIDGHDLVMILKRHDALLRFELILWIF